MNRDGWLSQGPPPNQMNMNRPNDGQPPPRASSGYGSAPPPNQQQQQTNGAPNGPPPPGSFFAGSNGPSLPGLASIGQPSPTLSQHRPAGLHETSSHSVPPQAPPYSLPGVTQAISGQPLGALSAFEREREMREREVRELREREAFEEQARRERERDLRQREIRERQQREQTAQQEQLQIHQPVAVGPRMQTAIHGPNGLLATGAPPAPPQAAPAQNSALSLFGGPPQYDGFPRGLLHQAGQAAQAMLPLSGPGIAQMPNAPMAPGQQPILNDALSYLDQVKVQFAGEPNVYNQFLDIMKDFKSQSIDTPGVIRRVSTLFAGNPNLIQGFNTFLPPGYRIECGTADDPNAIRVTTPMGTTVSPMGGTIKIAGEGRINGIVPPPAPYDPARPGESGWPHQSVEQGDGMLDPAGRTLESLFAHQPGANQARLSPFDFAGREAVSGPMLAQQEQRNVVQLQNAAAMANNDAMIGQMAAASPLPDLNSPMAQNGAAGMEKRGPVEFNHAISYVNKIKNRFASQPEIYKQFLEILQTYQRESKPIQDVYAQVTQLFNDAPDLLQDFKQFLPESAAHAKAAAARQAAEEITQQSNLRGEYASQGLQQTPRSEQHRLPPVGNFAPTPSANRDIKRKRADRQNGQNGGTVVVESSKTGYAPNKRVKSSQMQPQQISKASVQPEVAPVSPSLVPALPEPMQADTTTIANHDELAFFDRVKKYVGNKNTMNEFLKLCNLFSQDLIDKNALVQRVQNFIGGNPDLIGWFKQFVGYDGKDQVIENKAKTFQGRVSLNNCRSYGPSYRLLPKRERQKTCSGRDELCTSVLNDDWASHPTWASEDSGFITHRKNQFEEHLYRIEEERHDYDHYIAILERTIQILVPLLQHRQMLPEHEWPNWHLPKHVGGQSAPIMKRAIAKIYTRAAAISVFNDLIDRPAAVLPVLLARAKQKLEEWKASHREWEKVWRDQTQKFFWKSLDHQGINAKLNDKRQFQTKTLQNEIQVKAEEQQRQRLLLHATVPNYQAKLAFSDVDVIVDASRLLLTYAEHTHSGDFPKLTTFIKYFIPTYFGLDPDAFNERIRDVFDGSPSNGDMDDDTLMTADESPAQKGKKSNGKKTDLLRDVLGRGRKTAKEGSLPSSRASTPGIESNVDEEMTDATSDPLESDTSQKAWFVHATSGNSTKKREYKVNEPFKRTVYNMYANLTLYCFFRMFTILYERLHYMKISERDVYDTIRKARTSKAAIELRMIDKTPDDFFTDTSANANYYTQMLQMFEDFLQGNGSMDMAHIEEILRRYYLKTGWMLYAFDKLLSALVRFAISVLNNDGKDKSSDIFQLFSKDRRKDMTTHQDELTYRRNVEKHIKEGEMYRIAFTPIDMTTTIRILPKAEATYDLTNELDTPGALTEPQRWDYYISTFKTTSPTEGVRHPDVHPGVLARNFGLALKHNNSTSLSDREIQTLAEDEARRLDKVKNSELLCLRISPVNYSISFDNTSGSNEEWWIGGASVKDVKTSTEKDSETNESTEVPPPHPEAVHHEENERSTRDGEFDEKFVMNSRWMKGLTRDAVDEKNTEWRQWKESEV